MKVTSNLRHNRTCRRLSLQLLQLASQRGMNRQRVRCAIVFADNAHLSQQRKSGEPFITHPLLVATLVAELGGSEDDVIAALLHDTVEDNANVRHADIAVAWGSQVMQRVEVLTKDYQYPPQARLYDAHGRLIQALATLGRGPALIKIADRCHNSATSQHLPSRKLEQLVFENQLLFSPLAHMVGAHGLAKYLANEPRDWWRAASEFITEMRAVQAPLPDCESASLSP